MNSLVRVYEGDVTGLEPTVVRDHFSACLRLFPVAFHGVGTAAPEFPPASRRHFVHSVLLHDLDFAIGHWLTYCRGGGRFSIVPVE